MWWYYLKIPYALEKFALCILRGSLLDRKKFTFFAVSTGCFLVTVLSAAISAFLGL